MDLVGALDFFTSPDGIICLIVGAIVGGAAIQLLKGWGIGLVGNLVLGAIGGVIGGYAFDVANIIDVGDYADPVIAAIVGAVILVGIVGVVRR
jgi:uncharacterized membrane protein YeaQ/YmgE (transglycosylase-associated protein family)